MKSLSATNSKSLRKKADQQLEKLKADAEAFVALDKSNSTSPVSIRALRPHVRRADLPLLLRKNLTDALNILILTGNSTTDLLTNIARRATALSTVILTNCLELNDRAVIILGANCGSNLKTLSFNGCPNVTDESVIEIATYCINLQYLDLCRTGITERGVGALGIVFHRDALFNDSLIKRSSSRLVRRTFLRGLYLDMTRACRDGALQLIKFIQIAGVALRDLSIMDCEALDDEKAMLLIEALSSSKNLERFDARNSINPSSKEAEQAVISLGIRCPLINTLNVGGLGLEVTEFMTDLSKIYPNEGCSIRTLQW